MAESKNEIRVKFKDGDELFSPGACSSKNEIDLADEFDWIKFQTLKQVSERNNKSGISEININITIL